MPEPLESPTLMIVGAGDRGALFARLARETSPPARVVAVAEPRRVHRQRLARDHGIPPERTFSDWSRAAAAGRQADAVVIATPDSCHTAPALALIDQGYQVLLEKPMAPTPRECRQIVEAARRAGVILGVGHVLRYTDATQRLKALIDGGAIGEVMAVQRLEPIGYFHYAHSYVRGSWRREDRASFALLTKSCHDLDWLRYILGRPCRQVSSFGQLRHFRAADRPAGAADRCLDCSIEPTCPYSARKIYLERVRRGETGWPVSVVADEPSVESIREALRRGPYGRCVWACDNDVVDTQVVNLAFDDGRLATFIMTAFTPLEGRRTTVFGTRGQLRSDGRYIEHFDFLTDRTTTTDTLAEDHHRLGGHGGGDGRMLAAFVRAVASRDPSLILSGPAETLESHLMVFAAEASRRQGRVVDLKRFEAELTSPQPQRSEGGAAGGPWAGPTGS